MVAEQDRTGGEGGAGGQGKAARSPLLGGLGGAGRGDGPTGIHTTVLVLGLLL